MKQNQASTVLITCFACYGVVVHTLISASVNAGFARNGLFRRTHRVHHDQAHLLVQEPVSTFQSNVHNDVHSAHEQICTTFG